MNTLIVFIHLDLTPHGSLTQPTFLLFKIVSKWRWPLLLVLLTWAWVFSQKALTLCTLMIRWSYLPKLSLVLLSCSVFSAGWISLFSQNGLSKWTHTLWTLLCKQELMRRQVSSLLWLTTSSLVVINMFLLWVKPQKLQIFSFSQLRSPSQKCWLFSYFLAFQLCSVLNLAPWCSVVMVNTTKHQYQGNNLKVLKLSPLMKQQDWFNNKDQVLLELKQISKHTMNY